MLTNNCFLCREAYIQRMILRFLQGIRLSYKVAIAVGHRVVIKTFPVATIRNKRSHVVPTIEKSFDFLHVRTNDLKSSHRAI